MSNLKVRDGDGSIRYLSATGAGTDGDPLVATHRESNSAAMLAALSNGIVANATQRPLLYVTGSAATSGNNTIVAAPGAGLRIVLVSVQVQMESYTPTVALLKDGAAGSTILRVRGVSDGDGVLHQWPIDARPRLSLNTALVLNLSGANATGYSIYYYLEAA